MNHSPTLMTEASRCSGMSAHICRSGRGRNPDDSYVLVSVHSTSRFWQFLL